MYLLDTNVISEIRKPRPHGAVLSWMRGQAEEQLHLSAVTLLELQRGVERTRRQDPITANRIEQWIDQTSSVFQVISVDGKIAREGAKLMVGKPEDLLEDAIIAATARVLELTVATRNIRDFKQFDVPVFNPFTYAH